jgi:hypothetical protein
MAAPDCVVEDNDPWLDEDAAPVDSVLELATKDIRDDEIAALDSGALRLGRFVWTVDGAAKMDVEEDREPQSVADTVRVTVTAALLAYEV